MISIEKSQRSNKKEFASLLETHKEMEKTMKRNTYEINVLNNPYSKFEKNFFKRQSERVDAERMEQAVSFAKQIQAVKNAEVALNKEKNLISHDVDNVKRGEGSSRGSGSSRGGVSTCTRSKRKLVDEGGCRPIKRGGGRSGDRGGGSGGRGGRTLPPFQNLLTGEGFAYPNVKRKEQ
ncbi:uncharacterized protein LOC124924605 [Impatiens glandulifera]|uniref:uncharacterized protein LOC124924605 n=1 Tax=Impatiens glandulifera TaxID=253017 RepID=UPI001FB178D6|nr:uncharacterized protein LOC124924605 [Impatiens glandulifera]